MRNGLNSKHLQRIAQMFIMANNEQIIFLRNTLEAEIGKRIKNYLIKEKRDENDSHTM